MSYVTLTDSSSCDNQLPEGWYRFVGAAGTKMPTTRVPAYRVVQTGQAGWMVLILQWKMVKFKGGSALVVALLVAKLKQISVKNCGSYFIYKLQQPATCNSRFCGTD